jgi:hypothetical protein
MFEHIFGNPDLDLFTFVDELMTSKLMALLSSGRKKDEKLFPPELSNQKSFAYIPAPIQLEIRYSSELASKARNFEIARNSEVGHLLDD